METCPFTAAKSELYKLSYETTQVLNQDFDMYFKKLSVTVPDLGSLAVTTSIS